MDVRNDYPYTEIAQAVQANFAQAGIKVQLIPGDNKQTLAKYRARQHDIYIGEWSADYIDPHSNAQGFAWNPDNSDKSSYKMLVAQQLGHPATDEGNRHRARRTDRRETRATVSGDAEEMLARSPFVIMFEKVAQVATRPGVSGRSRADQRSRVVPQPEEAIRFAACRHPPPPSKHCARCPRGAGRALGCACCAGHSRSPSRSRAARADVRDRPQGADRSRARDPRRSRVSRRVRGRAHRARPRQAARHAIPDLCARRAARQSRHVAADREPRARRHQARVPGHARTGDDRDADRHRDRRAARRRGRREAQPADRPRRALRRADRQFGAGVLARADGAAAVLCAAALGRQAGRLDPVYDGWSTRARAAC